MSTDARVIDVDDARVIDVAFTRYDGPRAGRLQALWSLARWSALRALGARRSWKAKVIPIALALLAFAPALVILGARALFGTSSVTANLVKGLPYGNYAATVSIIILVYSVIITPELVCPDRRDRTLSLYFSTAISPGDYLAGKVLAAVLPLLLITLAPPLALYAGNMVFSVHPLGYLFGHDRRPAADRGIGPDRDHVLRAGRPRDLLADLQAGVRGRRLPRLSGRADPDRRRPLARAQHALPAPAGARAGADPGRTGAVPELPTPATSALGMGGDISRGGRSRDRGADPALPGRAGVSDPAIEFSGVSRWYGDTVSLAEVSFGNRRRRDRPPGTQRRR